MNSPSSFVLPDDVRRVIVLLLRGVLYADRRERDWSRLLNHRAAVREYLGVLGLNLVIDEAEGYSYVQQLESNDADDDQSETEPARAARANSDSACDVPALLSRRSLSYTQSLLCVLLRRRLAEADASGENEQTVVTRDEIIGLIHVFLPETASEARRVDRIDASIKKLVDYGFLRRLKEQKDAYEIRRIMKALVDASWLSELEHKLAEYRRHAEHEYHE